MHYGFQIRTGGIQLMIGMVVMCPVCKSYIVFRDGFIPKEFYCINCEYVFTPGETQKLIREAKINGIK